MFQNVIVGTDGGPGGRDAIALATRLRGPDGALTLAGVFPGRYVPVRAAAPGLVREDRDAVEQQLERERSEAGVDARLAVVEAPTPGAGLHLQAETMQADLLVLGSSRRGALGRTLLGDDTLAALDGAPCAIAVAPHAYAAQDRSLTTIGVGYDGSPESEAAVGVARALARRTGARVRAMQVAAIPSYSYTGLVGPVFDDVDALVRAAQESVETLDGVEGEAEYGLPGEELAIFSGEVDLLVVGSRGYGPLHRLISGSTARHLARHARGPLLVLPRGTTYVAKSD